MPTEKPGADAPLQFDRVQAGSTEAGHTAAERGVVCQSCGAAIRTMYFSLGSASICGMCRASFEESSEKSRSWPTFLKASLYGLAAAIAGAIVYYGVIAITNLEIGLVAILIGYMVGYSVRKATLGFGGLRYQVLALCLTYLAVSLAYVPLLFQAARDTDAPNQLAVTQTTFAAPSPTETKAEPVATRATEVIDAPEAAPVRLTFGGFLKAVGALALVFLGLPVLSIVYSMPSGLISAAIIGFGMRQAWRMTTPMALEVTGPYKVSVSTPA